MVWLVISMGWASGVHASLPAAHCRTAGDGRRRDISRDPFETIKPLLERARRKTSPRRVDLYEVFCAVLYQRQGRKIHPVCIA